MPPNCEHCDRTLEPGQRSFCTEMCRAVFNEVFSPALHTRAPRGIRGDEEQGEAWVHGLGGAKHEVQVDEEALWHITHLDPEQEQVPDGFSLVSEGSEETVYDQSAESTDSSLVSDVFTQGASADSEVGVLEEREHERSSASAFAGPTNWRTEQASNVHQSDNENLNNDIEAQGAEMDRNAISTDTGHNVPQFASPSSARSTALHKNSEELARAAADEALRTKGLSKINDELRDVFRDNAGTYGLIGQTTWIRSIAQEEHVGLLITSVELIPAREPRAPYHLQLFVHLERRHAEPVAHGELQVTARAAKHSTIAMVSVRVPRYEDFPPNRTVVLEILTAEGPEIIYVYPEPA